MSRHLERTKRVQTELRDYYSKLFGLGESFNLVVLPQNDKECYYSFGVDINLASESGKAVTLIYNDFFFSQDEDPDLDYILKTLNKNINQRIKEAHQIATLCPKQIGGEQ